MSNLRPIASHEILILIKKLFSFVYMYFYFKPYIKQSALSSRDGSELQTQMCVPSSSTTYLKETQVCPQSPKGSSTHRQYCVCVTQELIEFP